MKKNKILFVTALVLCCIIFSSCGKGYEVKVTNYNTEVLDSVIVGKEPITFIQIERQSSTEYRKLTSGDHSIKIITKTKKVYSSSISISKKGGGKRTIQIDGLNRISVLEE